MRENRRQGADRERVKAMASMMGATIGADAVERALGKKGAQRSMQQLQKEMAKNRPKTTVVQADTAPVPTEATPRPAERPVLSDF